MVPASAGIRALVSDSLVFPESPRWHEGTLWLSDMHAHRILRVALSGEVRVVAELDDKPSGLGFRDDGAVFVVSMRHGTILSLGEPAAVVHCDLHKSLGVEMLNDMVCLPDGTIYVGGWARSAANAHKASGVLVHLMPSGVVGGVYGDLKGPNGIAVSQDRATLIVAEMRGNALTAFDMAANGSLSGRRTFADLGEYEPDGICLDAEGAVWAGCPFRSQFIRVHEGARISQRITVDDDRWAVAPALGGEGRKVLYLVGAHDTMENVRACVDFEADLRSTARGAVFFTAVDVPGAGWP